jgi:hypothetical protein
MGCGRRAYTRRERFEDQAPAFSTSQKLLKIIRAEIMPSRSQARAAEQAFHDWNVRHLIELVGAYGLSPSERRSLAQELHRRAVTTRDLDRARVIADVWREGFGESRDLF